MRIRSHAIQKAKNEAFRQRGKIKGRVHRRQYFITDSHGTILGRYRMVVLHPILSDEQPLNDEYFFKTKKQEIRYGNKLNKFK